MTDLDQVLEAGTLLIIETGEYSDKSWDGPIRVVRAAKKGDLKAAFLASWMPTDAWDETPGADDFLPWLIKEGWVEYVENVTSWHVGDYDAFDRS